VSVTPADMKAEFAKDFAAEDNSVLQRAIDRAARQIGDAWGDLADDGTLYLAAHLRSVAKGGSSGTAGPVQSKKVGELSVTYSVQMTPLTEGPLASTAYGREYLRMLYTLPGARVYLEEGDNWYDSSPEDV
jgi:hypothetical protein